MTEGAPTEPRARVMESSFSPIGSRAGCDLRAPERGGMIQDCPGVAGFRDPTRS